MEDIEKALYKYCEAVRNAIEQCKKDGYFKKFPDGCCGMSSIWIYDYLKSKGILGVEFRKQDSFIKNYHHVWVHWKGYDMDITSDQFDDDNTKYPPVYVGKGDDLYKSYYDNTNREDLFRLEYIGRLFDESLIKDLEALYKKLDIRINWGC
nr:hypothetical protein [uncultured Bacteroides sp.]